MNKPDAASGPKVRRTWIKVVAGVLAWIASAGPVAAVTAVYTTRQAADANRSQAEHDYLRGERRVAYAGFERCENQISSAVTAAVVMSGGGAHPARKVPYPAGVGTALHTGLDCLRDAEIQVGLLAPAVTADQAAKVRSYYALQVQGFDMLQAALGETPQDEAKVNLGRSRFASPQSLDHPDPGYVDITDVHGRLVGLFRSDLGADS